MPLTVEEVGEVLLIFASRRLADQQVLPALLCVLLQKRSPQYFREVHNILHQSLIQARAGVGQPPRGGAAVCLSFHSACLRPAAAEGVV